MKITITINQTAQTFPHAVTVEMEELVGKSAAEARRYVDDKVKQFVTEAVSYSWAVEKVARPARATEQVAA